jgi:hypothetical protein
MVSLDAFFSKSRTVLALMVDASLAVELVGVEFKPSVIVFTLSLPLFFSFFPLLSVVILGSVGADRGRGGTGGLTIDSRRSIALAAAAFPTAFRLFIDTVEIFDTVDDGRFGTGGIFLPFASALVLAIDDAFDAVRFRPAVTFDAFDATDALRDRGSEGAVLNADEVSLLLVRDADETGRMSFFPVANLTSTRTESVEPGRDWPLEGLAFRMVEACEGASDLGRVVIEPVTLLATLFLVDAVEGDGFTRGATGDFEGVVGACNGDLGTAACDACNGDFEVGEGESDATEGALDDACEAIEGERGVGVFTTARRE